MVTGALVDVATVAAGVALGIVVATAIDAFVLAWLVTKLKGWWERL